MVLVYSIDRFGRNLKQSLTNADKIEEDNGILLVSATENFSNDPSGRFFRNVMMAHAQYYSDELMVPITDMSNSPLSVSVITTVTFRFKDGTDIEVGAE